MNHQNKARDIKVGSKVAISESFMNTFEQHGDMDEIPNHNHGLVSNVNHDHQYKHTAALAGQSLVTIEFPDNTSIELYSGALINLY